ncbi:MAG: hypothetical protein HYY84_00470 [Deltaproteobacteria bacterium]|nr:hypothetical protein [Deltaproteobacteria bacterium]
MDFVRSFLGWDDRCCQRILHDGHSLFFDEGSGAWFHTRFDCQHKPIVFDQIVFMPQGKILVSLDANGRGTWDRLRDELNQPNRIDLERLIISKDHDDLRPEIQPAFIRSNAFKYLLRAPDSDDADNLERRLRDGTLVAGWTQEHGPESQSKQPYIEKRLSIEIGDIHRAIAKTALNFVCVTAGPEVARHNSLDPLRDFCLRGGPQPEDHVQELWGQVSNDSLSEFGRSLARRGRHTMLMCSCQDVPVVVITLYGRAFALVRLTVDPVVGLWPDDSWALAVFDYAQKTHRIRRRKDDPAGFFQELAMSTCDR